MNPEKFSPLTEASFYILISLITPLHGYGVMKKVDDLSSGRVKLASGTLYGALSNLHSSGLITNKEGTDNRKKKLYEITQSGVSLAEHEIKRLQEMVHNGTILMNKTEQEQ
ncbi:MAG: PadR family transcriptional regulator [Spirochaetales bacterium]|nr:PadR family transcriptional regulator [Spirochaetales bacterium]